MTKVTHYMYSCDTCCKNREMMEMDGLDSAKCQNSEKKKDMMGISKIVNEEKDKNVNSLLLQKLKPKMGKSWKGRQWLDF